LTNSILIILEVKTKIFRVPGNIGKSIQNKLSGTVFDKKNHGLKTMNTISNFSSNFLFVLNFI